MANIKPKERRWAESGDCLEGLRGKDSWIEENYAGQDILTTVT